MLLISHRAPRSLQSCYACPFSYHGICNLAEITHYTNIFPLKGKITQWQKKEGDKIEAGDVIANVETDKATIDFVYQDDGYLAKILIKEGQGSIKVGDVIKYKKILWFIFYFKIVAIVVDEQADVKAFSDYTGEESAGAEAEEAEPQQETKPKKQEKAAPSEQAGNKI